MDDEHTLSVYDWASDILVSRTQCGIRNIFGLAFLEDSSKAIVVGDQYLRIWSNLDISLPTSTRPIISSMGRTDQQFICCKYFMNYPVIGTQD